MYTMQNCEQLQRMTLSGDFERSSNKFQNIQTFKYTLRSFSKLCSLIDIINIYVLYNNSIQFIALI